MTAPVLVTSLVEYSLNVTSSGGSCGVGLAPPAQVPLQSNVFENVANGGSTANLSYRPAGMPGEFAIVRLGASTLCPSGDPLLGDPGADHNALALARVFDTFMVNKPLTVPGSGINDVVVDPTFDIRLSGTVAQTGGTAF